MLKIVIWDKRNNIALTTFSNAPLDGVIEFDLIDATMKLAYHGGVNTIADICNGDVFEIRVTRE